MEERFEEVKTTPEITEEKTKIDKEAITAVNQSEEGTNIKINTDLRKAVFGNINLMPEDYCISKDSEFATDVMMTFGELIKDRDNKRARDITPEKWKAVTERLEGRIKACENVIDELKSRHKTAEDKARDLASKTENDDGLTPEQRGEEILKLQEEGMDLSEGAKAKARDLNIFKMTLNKVKARDKQIVRDIFISKSIGTILISGISDEETFANFKKDYDLMEKQAQKDELEVWQEIVKDIYFGRMKDEMYKIMQTNAEVMIYLQSLHDEFIGTRKDPQAYPVIDWSVEDDEKRYKEFNAFWLQYVDELAKFLEVAKDVKLADRGLILDVIKTARAGILSDLFKDALLAKKQMTPSHNSVTAYYYKTVLEPIAQKVFVNINVDEKYKAPYLLYVMCLLTDPSHFYSVFILM